MILYVVVVVQAASRQCLRLGASPRLLTGSGRQGGLDSCGLAPDSLRKRLGLEHRRSGGFCLSLAIDGTVAALTDFVDGVGVPALGGRGPLSWRDRLDLCSTHPRDRRRRDAGRARLARLSGVVVALLGLVERQATSDPLRVGDVLVCHLIIDGALDLHAGVATRRLDLGVRLGDGDRGRPFGLVLGGLAGDGLCISVAPVSSATGLHTEVTLTLDVTAMISVGYCAIEMSRKLTRSDSLGLGGEAQLLVLGDRLGDRGGFGDRNSAISATPG